ncbi:hypothetical protein MST22_01230 [Virgibacillus halodenitrificans]|uniref:hypothetical protein n=1 Tax=Virgibacillus halodenitrificans TaxID=1482 RepID=UPI001FB2B0BE|nr:hypothetical protein [Virgibacillus halodenitrificans]MCJ0929782.1 hypothetical protein [Virgibacillus halodenitrificans]
MSKRDTEKVLRIALNFLEGLTVEQFQELIEGNAEIHYKAKKKRYLKEIQKIEREAKHTTDVEKILEGYTKKKLLLFCEELNLPTKTRETKKVIYQKIAAHFGITDSAEHECKKISEAEQWKPMEDALSCCNTVEEANEFLLNQDALRLKKDIVAFAKHLGVYVNQRYTKQELLERIVNSVVGSGIRGKAIRMEE